MAIYKGTQSVTPSGISTAYVGNNKVYESNTGTISINIPSGLSPTTNIYYSMDGSTWTQWKSGKKVTPTGTSLGSWTGLTFTDNNTGLKMAVKNTKNYLSVQYMQVKFAITESTSASGNIMSLLNYTTVKDYSFYGLFKECTGLTSAPSLPATSVGKYSYLDMFEGCTALTTAPELPATTLAEYCYQGMFYNCTALTTAPSLPATTLANGCYSSMFSGCKSLTTAPELPATTLANSCYYSMFYRCTALTTAPELPATTLAEYCYSNMFSNCTRLQTMPDLQSTQLSNYCYQYMFSGCISLQTLKNYLPATTLTTSCYAYMFSNCTSLETPPVISATTLADFSCQFMFAECTKLHVNENGSTGTAFFTCPDTTGLNDPVRCMFLHEGGSFDGTPTAGNTYKYYYD